MSGNIRELFTELKWNVNLRFVKDEEILPRFTIEGEINRQYSWFNAAGSQLTILHLPPFVGEENPMSHFLASVSDLFEYALRNCCDSDMVGITITNEENVQDKAIGLFSKKGSDKLRGDLVSFRESSPV
jgi:hypothetical protein